MASWTRAQVGVGQVWEHDGLLYKVVGIADDPTVILVPLSEGDGEDREHYVIGSSQFGEFRQVHLMTPDGGGGVMRDD